jgi:hypothetical protein
MAVAGAARQRPRFVFVVAFAFVAPLPLWTFFFAARRDDFRRSAVDFPFVRLSTRRPLCELDDFSLGAGGVAGRQFRTPADAPAPAGISLAQPAAASDSMIAQTRATVAHRVALRIPIPPPRAKSAEKLAASFR